jgi:hypothetical protein
MNLVAVSAVDFEKARKAARNLYHRVKLAEDPASDKAEAKAKLAETLGQPLNSIWRGKKAY